MAKKIPERIWIGRERLHENHYTGSPPQYRFAYGWHGRFNFLDMNEAQELLMGTIELPSAVYLTAKRYEELSEVTYVPFNQLFLQVLKTGVGVGPQTPISFLVTQSAQNMKIARGMFLEWVSRGCSHSEFERNLAMKLITNG